MKNLLKFLFVVLVVKLVSAQYNLKMLTESQFPLAKCLDGSSAGYYYQPGSNGNTSWIINLEGGGWCYEESDCYTRAHTNLGSSKGWTKTVQMGGIMSNDCSSNAFCGFNKIFVPYCDGMSFTGMRDAPMRVDGDKGPLDIYFRGKAVLNAIVADSGATFGLVNATQMILTGCSAGGLASYFNADYLPTILPKTVNKYAVYPDSGFFLNVNTVSNQPVYPQQMKYIFEMANASYGVNQKCIQSHNKEDQWQCVFAENTYPHIESPIFVANSVYDSWQFACIFTAAFVPKNSTANGHCWAEWFPCAYNLTGCSTQQVEVFNAYHATFLERYRSSPTSSKKGNGCFLYSCLSHCGDYFVINGVSMPAAFTKYWNSNFMEDAKEHSYFPCTWNTTAPYNCNPNCPKFDIDSQQYNPSLFLNDNKK